MFFVNYLSITVMEDEDVECDCWMACGFLAKLGDDCVTVVNVYRAKTAKVIFSCFFDSYIH